MREQIEFVRLMAQEMGLSFSDGLIREVAADRAAFLTRLEELRKVSLPFIEAIEPAHALIWIVRRGLFFETARTFEEEGR